MANYIRQNARGSNIDLGDLDDDRLEDPRGLARLTGRMHQQQPDMLSDMLGGMLGGGGKGRGNDGAMGGMLSNPIATAAMAGITAMDAKKMMGR